MKEGDVVESAIWLTGEETEEQRMAYEYQVCGAISMLCRENGFFSGPVQFVEKRPGDARVPDVPEHIHGDRVRLLIAEATVVAEVPVTLEGSFVNNLSPADLERLRAITRKHSFPEMLSDSQCDKIIEDYGPRAALATLKSLH